MARNIIPLFRDRLLILDKLDYEQSGKLFKAIYYYCERRETELNSLLNDGLTDILFTSFKGSLDIANDHYEKVCEKRKAAGIKGNQARWGKPQENSCGTVAEDGIANDSKCDNLSQMVANATDLSQTSQKVASVAKTKTKTKTKTKLKEDSISSKDDLSTCVDDAIDYKSIMDYWNDKTNGVMGKVKSIDGTRRIMVRARIKQYGMEEFLRMIDMAAASDYLHDKQWANFGWCIKPNNFIKVLEGAYITRQNNEHNIRTRELGNGVELIEQVNGSSAQGQVRPLNEAEKRRRELSALEGMLSGKTRR